MLLTHMYRFSRGNCHLLPSFLEGPVFAGNRDSGPGNRLCSPSISSTCVAHWLLSHGTPGVFFSKKKKKNADHGVLPEDEKKPSPRKQKPSSNSDAQSMWIPSSGAGTCVEYIAFPAKTGPSAWNFLRGQVYRARGTAGRAV